MYEYLYPILSIVVFFCMLHIFYKLLLKSNKTLVKKIEVIEENQAKLQKQVDELSISLGKKEYELKKSKEAKKNEITAADLAPKAKNSKDALSEYAR